MLIGLNSVILRRLRVRVLIIVVPRCRVLNALLLLMRVMLVVRLLNEAGIVLLT